MKLLDLICGHCNLMARIKARLHELLEETWTRNRECTAIEEHADDGLCEMWTYDRLKTFIEQITSHIGTLDGYAALICIERPTYVIAAMLSCVFIFLRLFNFLCFTVFYHLMDIFCAIATVTRLRWMLNE
jgi:hypothetical protein